jgi:hypothetical protein
MRDYYRPSGLELPEPSQAVYQRFASICEPAASRSVTNFFDSAFRLLASQLDSLRPERKFADLVSRVGLVR